MEPFKPSPCDCGRSDWHVLSTVLDNGVFIRRCNFCSGASMTYQPDVFFKEPGHIEHLSDPKDSSTWEKGVYVTSRAHKAEVMKKLGVREAGDRVHGASSFDPVSHRHAQRSLHG